MPHAARADAIVVAAEARPEFWEGIRGWAFRPVSPEEMALLEKTYGVREDGEIDVVLQRPGRAPLACRIFHRQVPQLPPHLARKLFANLCQYVAVAEGMPGRLDHLNALPRAVQRPASDVPLTDLNVFDERYDRMGLGNFVWYEWQLLFAARAIYNAGGLPRFAVSSMPV